MLSAYSGLVSKTSICGPLDSNQIKNTYKYKYNRVEDLVQGNSVPS